MRDRTHPECTTNVFGLCSIDLSPTSTDSPGPDGDSDTVGAATQDVSADPDWSAATTYGGAGATESQSAESAFPGSWFGSGSAATSTSASTSTPTSSFTSTSRSHMRVRSSPVISSLATSAPSTPVAQPSSSPPPGPSAASATHGRSLPTPALAGSISSAVLATVAAAILLRLWLRRRRSRALLSTTQDTTTGTSASDHSTPAATTAVVRPRSKVHPQANDDVSEIHTRTDPVVSESGSSRGARYGSVTSLEPSPSSSSRPPPVVSADGKDCECHGQELPPTPVPPSTEHLPDHPGRPADGHAAPEQETAATAAEELEEVHPSERLLHFALPWALGQRMLAMMADEERVGGEGEEALPAYEPRG